MLNFCVLVGIVETDPVLSYYSGNHPVTRFDLSIWHRTMKLGRIRVECGGDDAKDVVKYVKQRDLVLAAGYISTYKLPDEDGVMHMKAVLHTYRLEYLGKTIYCVY